MNVSSRNAEDRQGNTKLENRDEEKDHHAKRTWADVRKSMKTFFWNPETREFMGRTALSWGVMIRPHTNKFLNIKFSFGDPESWQPYVENIEQFLEAYDDSVQERKNAVCTPGSYFIQDIGESTMKRACQFKRSLLKNCSGLEDKTFGYSRGHPCVLLKMNRIIGYRPGYGTPVTVSCKGRRGSVNDVLAVDFYPSNTFDPMYFPYYGKRTQENYTSPLVAMMFTVRMNQTVNIQCQLNGVGIINDAHDLFLGRVIFHIVVNH